MNKALCTGLIFLNSYRAVAQPVTVAPARSEHLYQWLENPVQVTATHTHCNAIIVKATKGTIKGSDCKLIYTIASDSVHSDTLKVGIRKGNKVTWLSATEYRVMAVPNPEVTIAGKSKDARIARSMLISAHGPTILSDDLGFCLHQFDEKARIKSYSVSVIRNFSVVYSENQVAGDSFPPSFKEFISSKSKPGDKILFDHLVAILYRKEIRPLKQTITLTLY